jgi:hypothetical protein
MEMETPEARTLFPCASLSWTVTAGLIDAPAFALVGCCANSSCVAAPAEMVNATLVADSNPECDAERVFVPERLMLRSENVATPAASVERVVVPPSVPVPDESAIVTVTPDPATLFPNESRT